MSEFTDLFHGFGANPAHRVDTALATRMLRASRCRFLGVNTHTLDAVRRADDLPIGYWTATLGAVRDAAGDELDLRPVLNINHPTTAAEAVDRARRAVDLTGIQIVKLEVLDETGTVSRNDEVVRAARTLVGDGLRVWPLIAANAVDYVECVGLGCEMVRVMGSPIGSRRGFGRGVLPILCEILAARRAPVLLEGGLGSAADVRQALELGMDAVLVNSCLFTPGTDPVAMLQVLRVTVDAVTGVGSGWLAAGSGVAA